MNGGGQFRVYPWPDLKSFDQVTSILIALDLDQIPSTDFGRLDQLVWCRDQLIVWKSKFHSQHYHELNASCSLLTAIVAEARYHILRRKQQQQEKVVRHDEGERMEVEEEGQGQEEENLLIDQWKVVSCTSQQELCILYATALMEFFKMLAYYEIKSNGKVSKSSSRSDASVVRIAERIKIPAYIVEYRHRIAHSQPPNFRHLKQACTIAMNWLNENYWARVSIAQQNGQDTFEDTLEKLHRLITQLTSSSPSSSNRSKSARSAKKSVGLRKWNENELEEMRTRMQRLVNVGGQFCVQLIAKRLIDDTLNEFVAIKQGTLKDNVKKEFEILDQLKNLPPDQETESRKKSKHLARPVHQALQSPCPFNLMSDIVFDRFAPIFQCLIKLDQPQWLPLLMSSLVTMFEDQDVDIQKTAKLWFAQLQLSILYSFLIRDLYTKQKPSSQAHYEKIRQVITSSYSMFCLTGQQQADLRWLHLFHQLISNPSVNHLTWVLAKNFYPFIKNWMNAPKFDKTIQLLAVYVGVDRMMTVEESVKSIEEQSIIVKTLDELTRNQSKEKMNTLPIDDLPWRHIPFGINNFNQIDDQL